MKILHLCLGGPVTDGWNYQDNMLTKYHVRLGYDVTLICSQWIWGTSGKIEQDNRSNYINADGVKMLRLPLQKGDINTKFKRYIGLNEAIVQEQPDIIFQHGAAYLDNHIVANYCKEHTNVRLFVDNHADFSNSATNWLSKNILHKIIWRHYAQMLVPYAEKFYGVLPARVDFLTDVYGIPKEKCELLVMGADDEMVAAAAKPEVAAAIRRQYGIAEDEFLVMTGGKIDLFKQQTLLLMQAVRDIQSPKVKLIVFGSVVPELKEQVDTLTDGKKVQYIGWVQSVESYKYFAAADLVVFPGRHSVFWEQVCGQGKPMLVKDWPGTHHVDLGGNVRFLTQDSAEEIRQQIEDLVANPDAYNTMKAVSEEKGMQTFSYREIAKRSIE